MNIVSILNRITFTRLPDKLFSPNAPILIGTARGGHTSVQNWINITILDYLEINYKISSDNLKLLVENNNSTVTLQPLDLRSVLKFKSSLWGYIANDPGHAFRLKERKLFIFIRSPLATFQSLKVLAKEAYGFCEIKSNNYALNYLLGWSKRFSKLKKLSCDNNLKIFTYKSEDLFANPNYYVKNILDNTILSIPEEIINDSILKYNKKLSSLNRTAPLNNPRKSYKSEYTPISSSDEKAIKDSFLFNYYNEKII